MPQNIRATNFDSYQTMRGGYREGVGRKQGFAAKSAEVAREQLAEMVMREIESIGKALIKKAKTGDVAATRELFDRAFGNASQNAKIELGRERPVAIYFDKAFEHHYEPPIYGGRSVAPSQIEGSNVAH